MNRYPDIQRVDVYSNKTSDRLEFEVRQKEGIWEARTLRLTPGRVMRAPDSVTSAPKLESISLQAGSYDELASKCKEKFESETGETAELTDSRYINSRVEDWVSRLDALFALFETQLDDASFAVSTANTVLMNEELMQKFYVKPVQLQSMQVLRDGKTVLMLKPKGLWVTGVNGRVDLMTPTDSYLLLDTAEFGHKPKWVIYDRSRKQASLTKRVIRRILADERVW